MVVATVVAIYIIVGIGSAAIGIGIARIVGLDSILSKGIYDVYKGTDYEKDQKQLDEQQTKKRVIVKPKEQLN